MAVRIRDEQGASHDRVPDLAVWLPDAERPIAVIVESGHRRDDRQRRILEGWRDAVHAGQYARIRYDCTSASVAQRIKRLADKAWLRSPKFVAAARLTGDEIIQDRSRSPRCDTLRARVALRRRRRRHQTDPPSQIRRAITRTG
jgi:hypothetical protein